MAFDAKTVETITVDSYGTLVDPSAVRAALGEYITEVEPVSELWRSRSLTYTMVGNAIDQYQSFYAMNRDALEYALRYFGHELQEDDREEILSVYHELDPFEDVREGIRQLTDLGYPIYVVSNGSPAMLESMVEHADLADFIEDRISAHEIERFKPEPEIYRHAAGRTGTPIHNIAHVASPTFDVQGAKSAGMQGVWLNRTDDPWETFGPDTDLVVSTFHELANRLD